MRASPVRSLVLAGLSLLVALVATIGAMYQPPANVTLRSPLGAEGPAALDAPAVAPADVAPGQ